MEGSLDVDLLPGLTAPFDDLKIARDRAPLAVIHNPRALIAHPRVRASSARVDP